MGIRTALPICLLALAPLAARAQTAGNITVTETSITASGGFSDGTINIAECLGPSVSTMALAWTVSPATAPPAGSAFRVQAVATGGCDASSPFPIENDIPTSGSLSGQTTTAFNVRDMLVGVGLDACTVAAITQTITLCATLVQAVGGGLVSPTQRAQTTVTLDTRIPGTPTDLSTSSGDSALNVNWSTPSGGVSPTNHRVTARACPASFDPAVDAPSLCTGAPVTKNTNSAGTSYRFTGLANGTWYAMTVQAVSSVGNGSVASSATTGQPQIVDDFWRHYQNAGGQETGGCGSGGAGLLALLALLPLALRRRNP